jgi:uncharacterized membrane protein
MRSLVSDQLIFMHLVWIMYNFKISFQAHYFLIGSFVNLNLSYCNDYPV